MQKWRSLLAHLEVFDERGECLSEQEMLEFETKNKPMARLLVGIDSLYTYLLFQSKQYCLGYFVNI